MNRQLVLDSWASGELFGISEQFARGGVELSGVSGWFALASGQLSGISGYLPLAPAAQILPRGHRLRHATVELSDATGQSSRPPDDLEDATGRSENAPDGLENAPGRSSRHPGRLSRSPGELEHAPADSERPPSESEGSGAARREGMDGSRRPGVRALARVVGVPVGPRGVGRRGMRHG